MRNRLQQSGWRILALLLCCCGMAVAQEAGSYRGQPAKYVFLFIGDGMSSVQRFAADYYKGALENRRVNAVPTEKLLMNSLPYQGLTATYSTDSIITDSAAAATAIATGVKTDDGVIGMDATRKQTLPTIAEMAHRAGRKVGVITSVSLDHATPAGFYAHVPDRGKYYEIGEQMVRSGFDYFGGGQLKGNQPKSRKERPDLLELARQNGYVVVSGRDGLASLKPGARAIAFTDQPDGEAALQYSVDAPAGDPTLADYTRKGIELLQDAPQGFFLMIEGGKIDWACHANDAKTAILESLALDEAVRAAYEFQQKHPQETLIVVTGDHETGGMSIGFAGTKYKAFPEKLTAQKQSFVSFDRQIGQWRAARTPFADAQPLIRQAFGFEKLTALEAERIEKAYAASMVEKKDRPKDEGTYLLYGDYEPLSVTCTHLLNNQAGLGWTSYAHTGVPVVTTACGLGAEQFTGFYQNTDIFHKLKAVLGL